MFNFNLKEIITRVKNIFTHEEKPKGIRKNKGIVSNRKGDYSHAIVPDELIGLSNAEVCTYIAREASKVTRSNELHELGRVFAKWLNTKVTSAGTLISINFKRDLLKQCINEIKAHNIMRLDLDKQIKHLSSTHDKYRREIRNILLKSDQSEYTQAETIGKAKNDLLGLLDEHDASDAFDDVKALQVDSHIITWLYAYAISGSELKRAVRKETKKLNQKHRHTITVRMADIQQMITYGLSDSNKSYGRLAVALALATGRRSIELLHTGRFEVVQGSFKPLKFKGQAKKKKGVIADNYLIYCIGCKPEDVVEGIKRLRKHPKVAETLTKAQEIPAHKRNRFIKERTHSARLDATTVAFNHNADRTFKDTRAIYASICVDTMKPKDSYYHEKQTDEVFLSDLLGHNSIKEQLHYKQFVIDYEAGVSAKVSPMKKFDAVYEGDAPTPFDTLDVAIDNMEIHKRSRTALLRLNEKVKAYAIANPSTRITKTLVLKKIGCSKNVADNYLGAKDKQGKVKLTGIAEAVIQAYNDAL